MSPKWSIKRSAAAAASSPAMSRMVDYRCPADESWYDVWLLLDGEGVLRIMYCNFSEATDELYTADRFCSAEELEEFSGRFRPTALQLQDSDCPKVRGMRVCASHAFAPTDIRFYNAVVEDINAKAHSVVDGNDECRCEFVLRWEQGPLVGKKQCVGIEHICVLQNGGLVVDPVLERFMSLAKKKFEGRATGAGLESAGCHRDFCSGNVAGSFARGPGSVVDGSLDKPQLPPCKAEGMETLDMKHDFRHTFPVPTELDITGEGKLRQDIDLGSSKKKYNYAKEGCYFIRIENLETDLSPCCVMDFIREQTSLSCQVSINPPSISELYTRGFIIVETKGKAEKLFEFFLNPEHIIMSSRGRPWVVNERWCGSLEWVMPTSENLSWNHSEHKCKINIVRMGSVEYDKADEQLKIHKEFHAYINLLHKRLAIDERALRLNLDANIGEQPKKQPLH